MRRYDYLVGELKLEETSQQKTTPRFKKLIMESMVKARAFHVDFNELVETARQLGSMRRGLPYKTHGRHALIYSAMKALTRNERIAVNALAGTRPSAKMENGQMAPVHPLKGDWIALLPGFTKSKPKPSIKEQGIVR